MKKVLAVLFVVISMFLVLGNQDRANAWIGRGTGGSGSGGSSVPGDVNCKEDYLWMYAVDCAGVSWAYYKVNKVTNKDVKFPGLSTEPTNIDATIPAECSKAGGGFWHFGINSFGVRVVGDGLSTGGYYGHWSTMNAGHDVAEWAPYSMVTNLNGKTKQIIGDGAYVLDHYGYMSNALKAYQQVYASAYPGEAIPNTIPGNVWGFCWDPSMDVNEFQGRSAVQKTDNSVSWYNAMEKKRTDWVGNEEGKVNEVDLEVECDNDNGCNVSFRHFMRRTAGSGDSKYTVTRRIVEGEISASDVSFEVDYSDAFDWSGSKNGVGGEGTVYTIAKGTLTAEAIDKYKSPTDNSVFLGKSAIKMKAGDKVCETLEFVANNETGEKASTTACATVKAKEAVTEEKNASIEIRVKNSDVERYDYESGMVVYAKPGDTVTYKVDYNPAPQSIYEYCGSNSSKCQYELVGVNNYIINGIDGWKNAFLVSADGFSYDAYKMYNNGLASGISEEINSHKVEVNEVGKELVERAVINPLNAKSEPISSNEVWFTPTAYSNVGDEARVEVRQLLSAARVVIPYNFDTSVEVQDVGAVYAGENTNVKYSIGVVEKSNSLTTNSSDEKYKTKIKNPKVKTVVYYGGEKEGVSSYAGESDGGVDINLCGYFGGEKCKESGVQAYTNPSTGENVLVSEGSGDIDVPVPDVAAGTRICVAAAIYPANSGNDGNISEVGSDTWRISDSKCLPVAKKPSFQVWGGSVYSGGDISAPLAKKTDLAGYMISGVQMFGSWAEWGVVHNGKNQWLASGAGLGYERNNGDGTLWPNVHPDNGDGNNANIGDKGPGGYSGNAFCDVSTLTFPNDDYCGSNVTNSGGASNDANIVIDIEKLKKEIEDREELVGGDIEGVNVDNDKLYYYNDDINLKGNIMLGGGETYSSLEEMPKIVIYAKGNINIDYDVTEINAMLIADGDIDTCSIDKDNQSYSKDCSKQLSINGALIAGGEVKFNRTYGAATGANSMVPAEIINYNPALYLLDLGVSSGTASQSTIWEQVYTRELAPRY